MSTISDAELERKIRDLDEDSVGRDPATLTAVGSLVDELRDPGVRARQERMRPFWRRRPLLGALVGLVLAVGAVGVPAGAAGWLAHTGLFGGSGSEVDESEWIRVNASDAPDAIRAAYPTWMVLPQGWSRAAAERTVNELYSGAVTDADSDGARSVLTQETDIRRMFESFGRCAWYKTWIDADDNGDVIARDRAAEVLLESTAWPATVATDGGGVVAHLRDVAEAAESGERTAVASGYSADACTSFTGQLNR
ncbi:hypothetical protein ACFVU2_02275 [Leifsonia sp. NPDC058194]|uniref:hypothetical protein n=1 Tax=Leifsonia sp. NPDC058194 TaxID=3346374 RepID=UPI0036DBB8CF